MFNSTNLTLTSDVNEDTYSKVTKTKENTTHKRAKRSAFPQQVTTRLQGTYKTAYQTQTLYTNKKNPQMKHRLGTVSKKSLDGLNMFNGINRTLNSDEDQDNIEKMLYSDMK